MCVCVCVLSPAGRLFHCITTHQCSLTRRVLQAGIETWLTYTSWITSAIL